MRHLLPLHLRALGAAAFRFLMRGPHLPSRCLLEGLGHSSILYVFSLARSY